MALPDMDTFTSYGFETADGQAEGNSNLAGLSEADRLRDSEYEHRLQIARKAGSVMLETSMHVR